MASAGFPLWHAIRTGYTETFRNFGKVSKLAWKPFLAIIAIEYAARFNFLLSTGSAGHFVASHILQLLTYACFGLFALTMSRYRLLGWSAATDHFAWRLTRREWTFLAVILAFFLLGDLFVHMNVWAKQYQLTIRGELPLVTALIELIVLSRLAFILPAVASDVARPIARGRALGADNGLRLIALILPTLVASFAIIRLLDFNITVPITSYFMIDLQWGAGFSGYVSGYIRTPIVTSVYFLEVAILVTGVAAAYQARIAQSVSPASEGPQTEGA